MDFFIGSISFYNESNIIMQLKMQIKKPPSDKRDEGIFSVVPPKLIHDKCIHLMSLTQTYGKYQLLLQGRFQKTFF